jgi:CBS domain-containing protein
LEAAAGLFDDKAKAVAGRPIEPLVLKNVVTLKLTDTVNVAAGIMLSKMIRRLPVVESGKLIGSVARADIARSAMAD